MKQLVRYPTDKAWRLYPTLEAAVVTPALRDMLEELVTAYSFSNEPPVFFVVADDELTTIAEYRAVGWLSLVGEFADAEDVAVISDEEEIFGNFSDENDEYLDSIDWDGIDEDGDFDDDDTLGDDDFGDDYIFGDDEFEDEFEDEDYFDDDETLPDEPDPNGEDADFDYSAGLEEDE